MNIEIIINAHALIERECTMINWPEREPASLCFLPSDGLSRSGKYKVLWNCLVFNLCLSYICMVYIELMQFYCCYLLCCRFFGFPIDYIDSVPGIVYRGYLKGFLRTVSVLIGTFVWVVGYFSCWWIRKLITWWSVYVPRLCAFWIVYKFHTTRFQSLVEAR